MIYVYFHGFKQLLNVSFKNIFCISKCLAALTNQKQNDTFLHFLMSFLMMKQMRDKGKY